MANYLMKIAMQKSWNLMNEAERCRDETKANLKIRLALGYASLSDKYMDFGANVDSKTGEDSEKEGGGVQLFIGSQRDQVGVSKLEERGEGFARRHIGVRKAKQQRRRAAYEREAAATGVSYEKVKEMAEAADKALEKEKEKFYAGDPGASTEDNGGGREGVESEGAEAPVDGV